jgi:hypothetical protein
MVLFLGVVALLASRRHGAALVASVRIRGRAGAVVHYCGSAPKGVAEEDVQNVSHLLESLRDPAHRKEFFSSQA